MRVPTHFAASPAEVLVASRPNTATSTEFGAIPQFLFAPRDAQVIEAYYRYQLTPAIEVTPDVHWIHGMLGGLTGGDTGGIFTARRGIEKVLFRVTVILSVLFFALAIASTLLVI